MTKEKRDKLFGKYRPTVRPLVIRDNGEITKDVGLLWVSYKKGEFFIEFEHGMSQSQFLNAIENLSSSVEFYMVDDRNKEFKGIGPIAVVSVTGNGWKIFPHAVFFPWSTSRNKLRSAVSFFQMIRHKKIGAALVHSLKDSKALFDKCQDYGVLRYVGKVPGGDPRGDEYLYTVRGRK